MTIYQIEVNDTKAANLLEDLQALNVIKIKRKETANQGEKKTPKFGYAKGTFEMSPDFDEPLEDFKDYMP